MLVAQPAGGDRWRGSAARYPPVRQAPGRASIVVLDLAALAIPLFMWLEVRLVGRLFMPELLLLALLPFLLLTRGRMLATPIARTIMILGLLWLAAQIVTDVAVGSTFADYTRGWAKIGFTLTNFMTLFMLLYGRRHRVNMFAAGIALGGLLTFVIAPSEFATEQPWKFGVGVPMTILATLVAQNAMVRRSWLGPALLMAGLGLIGIYLGSRSLGAVTLLAAMYVLLQAFVGQRSRRSVGFSMGRTVAFLGLGLVGASMVLSGYQFVASQGLLGDEARERYEQQALGAFGILLGGRTEIYASSRAIFDSPLLGHGSWARNPYYAGLLIDLESYGYEISYTAADSDLIPTHSHIFGAWVEAGVIGGLFWLWVLWLVVRVLSNLYVVREPLTPLIAFVGILLLWDVLFSPYGADRRIIVPFFIVVMMFAWDIMRASGQAARTPVLLRRRRAGGRTRLASAAVGRRPVAPGTYLGKHWR